MKKLLTCITSVLLAGAMVACAPAAPAASKAPAATPAPAATAAPAPAASAPAATSAAPAATPAASAAATTAKDPSKMKIFFVSKLVGTQYWAVVEQGVRDACKELGITDLTINGPAADSEVEKQIQILQDAVSSKADAILIAPTDSTAMVNPVKDAFKSGIPMICIDTIIKSEDYSAALLTNNVEAGKMCAQTLIAKLQAAGVKEDAVAEVAIQVSSTGSQTVMDRVNGFNQYWDANAPKSWKVLNNAIKVNDGDIQKAINFGQDFITTYPNLKALFAPNNGSTVGFATALKESKRNDIVMLGFDYSNEIADLIQNTDLNVTTMLQKQYMMGYNGVKTAVALVQGKAPAEKKIDTGVMVVDKANVKSKEVQDIVTIGKK